MNLTVWLLRARVESLEGEVARLRQALELCPEGVERGHARAEVLRVIQDRPSVVRRMMRVR